jgi:site-specific recombinase XerD
MPHSDLVLPHVQRFFRDYLAAQRGMSPHTAHAYRDALKLYFAFVARRTGLHVASLTLNEIRADLVLEFLGDLQACRQNSTATRNHRLAALRVFARFLTTADLNHGAQYTAILAITRKQTPHNPVTYLERTEVAALLNAVPRGTLAGRRDYTLLQLLYNTGARVQELCDLRVGDVRLGAPHMVSLTGKGRKTRHVPLWPETATLVRDYLAVRRVLGDPTAPLFINVRGTTITRHGVAHLLARCVAAAATHRSSLATKRISPHTMRHTTAMHLLQSGVDLPVIQAWLGHSRLETTHAYVEIDLDMKRRALAMCAPPENTAALDGVFARHHDVLAWLAAL